MEKRDQESDGRRVRAHVRSRTRLLGAIALLTLAACGGGVETVENPIGNRPPIVNAGPDQDVAEGSDITLDGSGSTDPDGDALTFQWLQLAGPAVTLDSTSTSVTGFVAPDVPAGSPATLVFQLTVSDGELSQSDTVAIVVDENSAPTVDAGEDQTVFENAVVSLAGVASDPNGDALMYQWTQVSGPAVTLDNPTSAGTSFEAPDVAAGAPQTLTFQLTVSDGQFAQADTVSVRVEENEPPLANAGPDQIVASAVLVTLDGSQSSDPNTIDTLTFSWAQTGGPAVDLMDPATSQPSFNAPVVAPGSSAILTFELTVGDGVFSDTDSVTVVVGDDDPDVNIPPAANAGSDQVVLEGAGVTLSGSGTDADGDPLTFSWVQLSGPAAPLNDPASAVTAFVAPDVPAGPPVILTFELTVSDGTVTDSDAVSISVEENVPPVANAGPDQTVEQNAMVSLDGSLSDDPNSIGVITYSWVQIAGPAVTLAGSATATPSFTAPPVDAGSSELLQFELTVSDGTFDDSDTVSVTVEEQETTVGVSGRVNYEFVPPNADCAGLNFGGTIVRPIRGATVQLLDASTGTVIDTTVADDTGAYAFTGVDPDIDVRLRVRAELKRSGSPSWDVDVRDNTSNTTVPLPSRPLYVMDGSGFNTGTADSTQNLTATTGWGGTAYTADRTAAPFAILDAIYAGVQLVTSVDPGATFGPLDAYWSVNNTLVNGDIGAGEIGTSYYTSDPDGGAANPSLFLLGDADNDTEEFDDHVVVHEWGHYFEDTFSRSDSIGGRHGLGESLDPRLAFGEGFATALAAIALAEPLYCDTGAPGTIDGFGIDAENAGFGTQGWYNEVSIVTLVYDLWDTVVDGTDNGSIGFAPIYDTMAGPQATTPAFTSVFSFAAELRTMLDAAGQALLDSQLVRENIEPGIITIWADGETNNANHPDVLPVYTDMTGDGSTLNICTTSEFEPHLGGMILERNGNKLSEQRFLRLTVPTDGNYAVLVETTTPTPVTPDSNDLDQSDPDLFIYRNGTIVASGVSGDARVESFTTTTPLLSSAVYAVELEEFRYNDDLTPDNYPERVCFDVSFTPAP